ncbi:MAG: glycosyltransferase [Acidobacteriaceae bacterium]
MTQRPVRQLHVIRSLSPEYGGPAQLVRQIVSIYPSLGMIGEVACLDAPDSPFLKGLDFPVHPLGPALGVYGYSSKWAPWLRAHMHEYDGIIIQGIWQYQSWGTWRVIRNKVPYVQLTHGMLDPWFKRRYPLKHIKKWIYWVLAEYWVLRGAQRVLFTSTIEQQLAPESFWLHRWNGAVVPYGAEEPKGSPAALMEAFYAQCPQLRGQRFLLYLGRIHPKKGCDLLITAFQQVAQRAPWLHLLMAGPDSAGMRAQLQAQVAAAGLSNRVHWPGLLTGDAKWGAFFASEAFILPSHQENFGIAVAEALGCGRPVLISDQVNIWPEIQSDGAGLVAPDTLDGTRRLLEEWTAQSSGQREQWDQRARACFEQRYDIVKNVAELVRYFVQ